MSSIAAIPVETAAQPWRPGEFALRDAWFPVAHLPQLGAAPIRRSVHSQPYFLWRDGARIRATEFHPAYLAEQRALASEFTAGTAEYPLVIRYGHLWVWYGNPAAADPELIPDIPFLPRERTMPGYARLTNFFHCSYELVLENILDLTHIDYVHGNFSGPPEAEDDRIRFESTSETVTMIRSVRKRRTSEYQKSIGVREEFQDMTAFTHVFIRSGVCFLHAHYSSAPSMPLMQTNTPESRTLTRANAVFAVHESSSASYRRAWPKTGPMVAAQDEAMLNPQNPRYLYAPEQRDMSTRFDAAGLHYRQRANALIERQRRGDFSYLPDAAQGADLATVLNVARVNR
jgi:phenylpropionate dioxygenase-like ring-hydroxylating dioxygenase large terminal subunit